MQFLPRALTGLGSYKQFIICRLADRKGKITKLPIDHRTMKAGDPTDPSIWLSFEEASSTVQLLGDPYRLGFVFTRLDPFFFYDIDGCIDANGELNAVAQWSLDAFKGAAVESSQSGNGLHIFGVGQCPPHRCKNIEMGIELYTEDRFVMLTGADASGDCKTDCSQSLAVLVDAYFQPDDGGKDDGEWNDKPHPDWDGPEDDDLLLAKAMQSRSAGAVFGGKASFKDLFQANEAILGQVYPDSGGRAFDASSADAALAQHLAFWTGNNHERIMTLMWRSELKRDKWEDRAGYYLPRTIRRATSRQTEFYNANRKPSPVSESEPAPTLPASPSSPVYEPQLTSGHQYLTVEEQLDHFKDCVYVRDVHRVYCPDGSFLKAEQFRAAYGGYLFAMDTMGNKTSKNAWEVFTESQAIRFPKVHSSTFRPEVSPGAILSHEGRTLVNTYVPISTPRMAGDPSPFIDLLTKLLPDQRDRNILIGYLAGVAQYPGVKFQYCVVIQGAEGNGKTTIIRVLEHAIGQRYSHLPNSSELGKGGAKFTGWVDRKLFIGVEEIHIENKPGGLIDMIKPLLSNDRIELQHKGVDQVMGDNRANWVLLCNRKDDVPITVDTRRFCVFFTAQQSAEDVKEAGMTDRYWRDLYRWLKNENGYAILNEWLHSYKIPDEYNPTMISRAPATSATNEAVYLSKSEIEQVITEAIDADKVGFRGGWVSSLKLAELLNEKKIHCAPNKRRIMMQKLGYDYHPALNAGKASAIVISEQGRPKLYIERGHVGLNLTTPGAIQDAYEKAQGYVPNEIPLTGAPPRAIPKPT